MMPKHLFILCLALFASTVAQSDNDLQIPVENDNQFPPDNPSELDELPGEGSGAGVIDEPLESTTQTLESQPPLLEDVQLSSGLLVNTDIVTPAEDHSCPASCVCNIEGDSSNYVVDCSGASLTELPKPLDPKTTELNLQNNLLTTIPKDISELKNLKILNLNNNKIMEIAAGSISELSELNTLKLGNNRLIEYPTDLKNSFGLVKLNELDLGNNDMRTTLSTDTFSNFKALRTLTLPSAASDLIEDVCAALKDSLVTVCTDSCSNKSFDCPDAPHSFDDDLLDFALPGFIAFGTAPEDNIDPSISSAFNENDTKLPENTPAATSADSATAADNEILFRSAIIKASNEEPKSTDTGAKAADKTPLSPESKNTEEVVGATTSSTKTGGVDKGIIGMIVAGMVLVVAGITIKKNWSSIRNRFSSTSRNANERTGVNANGTAAEEVPLQEKSPV